MQIISKISGTSGNIDGIKIELVDNDDEVLSDLVNATKKLKLMASKIVGEAYSKMLNIESSHLEFGNGRKKYPKLRTMLNFPL